MSENRKVAILGASKGLGRSIVECWKIQFPDDSLLASSRKKEILETFPNTQVVVADFSKNESQISVLQELQKFGPEVVIYCAGGGPHGEFASKEWKDHEWALQVTFLFAAQVLHQMMASDFCKQMILIGSEIAENGDNRLSPSYGAGKAALKSLVTSVQGQSKDIRLLSPGYMDTGLLPPNAAPRKAVKLLEPDEVAAKLIEWVQKPAEHWHMRLPNL